MGLSVSHASLIKVLDELGKEHDSKVLQLCAALEENLAEELSDSRPATFLIDSSDDESDDDESGDDEISSEAFTCGDISDDDDDDDDDNDVCEKAETHDEEFEGKESETDDDDAEHSLLGASFDDVQPFDHERDDNILCQKQDHEKSYISSPTFKIVGDNIDKSRRPRYMRLHKKTKSIITFIIML